jgi:hypothetical protein
VPESDRPSGEGVVCEMMMVRPIAGNLHSRISGLHILEYQSPFQNGGTRFALTCARCVCDETPHQATDFRPHQVHIDHPI